MMNHIQRLLLTVCSIFIFTTVVAQENKNNTKSEIYNWDVTAKAGASLLWGDAASSFSPFTKWFSSECAFTGELVLNRRISNVFGIQAGFAKGVLSGYREVWSSDTHPVVSSKTDYFDYHLALNMDITSIFNHNPNRFLSIYAFGGVGMINYTATSYLDGKLHQEASDNTLMVPWGGGLRFRLSPRFSVIAETNFRNTFVDNIDAYEGQGSDVNDIYSITSIGLTYRFGQKKDKKREIEIVPVVPADTAIAQNDTQDYQSPVNVIVSRGMPVTAIADTTYVVQVEITKEDLSDYGQYSQTIPEGFDVVEVNSHGGEFRYDGKEMVIEWVKIPSEPILKFSYELKSLKVKPKTYDFEGSFKYAEDTAMRVKTFVDNVVVSGPPSAELADNTEDENQVNPDAISGIDYRVQVAAIFGGKSSADVIARHLKISETVYEDQYKRGYRYTVGHHSDYSEAKSHRRNVSVKGAYVVAFVDGKYVGDLAKTNEIVMDKDPFNSSGVTYKIQIAASKGRPYSIAKLASKYGFSPSAIYQDSNGTYYMYTTGTYASLEEAKAKLKEVRNSVKGAYIVKFVNGKRSR
jgi:hypothetical protein